MTAMKNFSRTLGKNYFQEIFNVETDAETLNYKIWKHYVPIPICIGSMICISVTIIVALRRGLWRPTAPYLVTLAIVDLLALPLLLCLSLDYLVSNENTVKFFFVVAELLETLLLASNWITAILAAERYIAICYPLKARRIRRKHRRITVITVVIVSVVIKIPSIVFSFIEFTQLYTPTWNVYKHLHTWILQVVIYMCIPFIVLAVVNLKLIEAVQRSSKFLQSTWESNSGKYNLVNKSKALGSTSMISGTYDSLNLSNTTSKDGYDWSSRDCYEHQPHSIKKSKQQFSNKRFLSVRRDKVARSNLNLTPPMIQLGNLHDRNTAMYRSGMNGNHYTIALTLNGPFANQRRRAIREERRITITLICLIVSFFIFQGPFIFGSVYHNITSNQNSKTGKFPTTYNADSGNSEGMYYFRALSIPALCLKSVFYFIFYCWFCKRFLVALKSLSSCGQTEMKCQQNRAFKNCFGFHTGERAQMKVLQNSHSFQMKADFKFNTGGGNKKTTSIKTGEITSARSLNNICTSLARMKAKKRNECHNHNDPPFSNTTDNNRHYNSLDKELAAMQQSLSPNNNNLNLNDTCSVAGGSAIDDKSNKSALSANNYCLNHSHNFLCCKHTRMYHCIHHHHHACYGEYKHCFSRSE